MSEKTPGQAAFETAQERLSPRNRLDWKALKPLHREHYEAEARAAIEVHESALRQRIRQLLADVKRSADATRPSAKTRAEDDLAAQLRQLLEEP